jgi:uncharacterized protein YhhL (DUF1145 family)
MKKLMGHALTIVWFFIVLGLTTSQLSNGNRFVYFIVTILLLVIPIELVKRFFNNKKKQK